ncbi:hypothetical protein FB451DRAFT_1171311 [Mycena latifolia]|nr:hypothetical protein FB451DRAFT_1171311 [Mycena latifolia]
MINNNSEYGSNRRGVRGGSKMSQDQSVWLYTEQCQEVRTELNSVSRARNKSGNQKRKLSQTVGTPVARSPCGAELRQSSQEQVQKPKREIESNVGNSGRNPAVANSGSHAKGALVHINGRHGRRGKEKGRYGGRATVGWGYGRDGRGAWGMDGKAIQLTRKTERPRESAAAQSCQSRAEQSQSSRRAVMRLPEQSQSSHTAARDPAIQQNGRARRGEEGARRARMRTTDTCKERELDAEGPPHPIRYSMRDRTCDPHATRAPKRAQETKIGRREWMDRAEGETRTKQARARRGRGTEGEQAVARHPHSDEIRGAQLKLWSVQTSSKS